MEGQKVPATILNQLHSRLSLVATVTVAQHLIIQSQRLVTAMPETMLEDQQIKNKLILNAFFGLNLNNSGL